MLLPCLQTWRGKVHGIGDTGYAAAMFSDMAGRCADPGTCKDRRNPDTTERYR